MAGGTTFHVINASPAEALETAREAADGQDVRLWDGLEGIEKDYQVGRLRWPECPQWCIRAASPNRDALPRM